MKSILHTVSAIICVGAVAVSAQKDDEPRFDQPIYPASLPKEKLAKYRAPLEVTVSAIGLDEPRGKISGCSGFNRNSWNLVNVPAGFEPASYRILVRPVKDSRDTVWLNEGVGNAHHEGFYDGARVRVYHPIDGKIVKVRDSRVAKGGHKAGGWKALHPKLSTPADDTEFKFAYGNNWNYFWRMDVPYYFMVRAVNVEGTESEHSNYVTVTPTESDKKAKGDQGAWANFKPTGENLSPPSAPKNLTAKLDGAVLTLSWDGVAGEHLAGYRVYMSTVDPKKHQGYALQLESAEPLPKEIIQEGDLVFIDCEKTRFDKSEFCRWDQWTYHHTWGRPTAGLNHFGWWPDVDPKREWELVKHPGPIPADFVTGGATCLKIRNDEAEPALVNLNTLGGSEQSWYWVMPAKKHRVEAWVRGEGGGELQIRFYGKNKPPELDSERWPYLGRKSNQPNPLAIPPVTLPLSGEWKKVGGEFTPPEVMKDGLTFMELCYTGPGTVYVDDLRIYEADKPPIELPPMTVQRLRESHMRFQRTHELIKTKGGYSLSGMTGEVGSNNISNGQDYRLATFYGLLKAMKEAGNYSPWLQVEMCLAEDEWQGFAEWMAAPYDPAKGDTPENKPWAYKRWSMGQKKPWLDEFDEFAFEMANETWNGLFYPWVFNGFVRDSATGRLHDYGEQYGMFFQYVIDQLRASGYWTEEIEKKTDYVLNGWNGNNRHAAAGVRYCPDATLLSYAAYNSNSGLGDPKVQSDFKRFMMMQWSIMGVRKQLESEQRSLNVLHSEGYDQLRLGMYEYGPGYHVMPGQDPQREVDNNIARGMIGAVFTLDATMLKARDGHADQAFFTIGHDRSSWGSWALIRDGGHAYPFWKALALYNQFGTGTFLDCDIESMPRWDFPAYRTQDNMSKVKRDAVPDAPMISVYATRDSVDVGGLFGGTKDRLTVWVISRKLDHFPIEGDDGYTPVALNLPLKGAKSATLYRLSGDPREDDRYEEKIEIEPFDVPPSAIGPRFVIDETTGGDAKGVPPASIFMYVFEDANMPKANTRPKPLAIVPDKVLAGQPVQLGNATVDADGDRLSYRWDLDDAGERTEAEPTVTFPTAGLRHIALTADDGRGGTMTKHFDIHVELPLDDKLSLGVGFGQWGWSVPDYDHRAEAMWDGRTLVARPPEKGRSAPAIVTIDPVVGDIVIEADVAATAQRAGLVLCTQAPWFFHWAPGVQFGVLADAGGAVYLTGSGIDGKPRLPAGSVKWPCRMRLTKKGDNVTADVMVDGRWKNVGQVGGIKDQFHPGLTCQGGEARFDGVSIRP